MLKVASMFLVPAIIVLALTGAARPSQPKLSVTENVLAVSFDKGAVYANIEFKTGETSSYDNYFLSTEADRLQDFVDRECHPCKVTASIGYPQPNKVNPGTTDVVYVDSNTVTVTR